MIKATVGDLLDGKLDAGDCRLYVVRDGETVFYVGQSEDIEARLLAHMGLGEWGFSGPSQLGETIELNLPKSRQWQIELHRVERPELGLDVPERELIQRLCPHLNDVHNANGGGFLPDCYKDPRLVDFASRAPKGNVYEFDLSGLAKAPVQKRLEAISE